MTSPTESVAIESYDVNHMSIRNRRFRRAVRRPSGTGSRHIKATRLGPITAPSVLPVMMFRTEALDLPGVHRHTGSRMMLLGVLTEVPLACRPRQPRPTSSRFLKNSAPEVLQAGRAVREPTKLLSRTTILAFCRRASCVSVPTQRQRWCGDPATTWSCALNPLAPDRRSGGVAWYGHGWAASSRLHQLP